MIKNIEKIKQLTFDKNILENKLRDAYYKNDMIEVDILIDLITINEILLEILQK